MYCPILSVLCDRESYSTKIKSQWSKIFLYRLKTEKKNDLASGGDAEKYDIHEYSVKI